MPAEVRYCRELSASAKVFYTEITALADKKGYCFASNGYFSDLYEVAERQIQRWLLELSEMGFCQIEVSGPHRKIYVGRATKKTGSYPDKKDGVTPTKKTVYPDKKDTHSTIKSTTRLIDENDVQKITIEAHQNVLTPGPRDRQPFGETIWAESPEKWRLDMMARSADFEPVDLEYYRGRAVKWSKATGAKSADWVEMVADWIADDHKKGKLKLKTTNSTQEHETNRPNPAANSSRNGNIERAIARAERLAHKFGGGGGNE